MQLFSGHKKCDQIFNIQTKIFDNWICLDCYLYIRITFKVYWNWKSFGFDTKLLSYTGLGFQCHGQSLFGMSYHGYGRFPFSRSYCKPLTMKKKWWQQVKRTFCLYNMGPRFIAVVGVGLYWVAAVIVEQISVYIHRFFYVVKLGVGNHSLIKGWWHHECVVFDFLGLHVLIVAY